MPTEQEHRAVDPRVLDSLILPVLGTVDLDPCGHVWSDVPAATVWTGADLDGMGQRWHEAGRTVWMFPPTRPESVGKAHTLDQWVSKAYREHTRGATVLALLPPNTGSAWFHDFVTLASAFTLVHKNYPLVGTGGGTVRNDRQQLTVLWTTDRAIQAEYGRVSEPVGLLVENV